MNYQNYQKIWIYSFGIVSGILMGLLLVVMSPQPESRIEECVDELIEAKKMVRICEFAFDILDVEFNITGMIMESDKFDKYKDYLEHFNDFAEDVKEIEKYSEGYDGNNKS